MIQRVVDEAEEEKSVDFIGPEGLAKAAEAEVLAGGRVELYTPYNVVIRFRRKINHVFHLLLTILTVGIWLLVWAFDVSAAIRNEKGAALLT